jgi:hypothetical protein
MDLVTHCHCAITIATKRSPKQVELLPNMCNCYRVISVFPEITDDVIFDSRFVQRDSGDLHWTAQYTSMDVLFKFRSRSPRPLSIIPFTSSYVEDS